MTLLGLVLGMSMAPYSQTHWCHWLHWVRKNSTESKFKKLLEDLFFFKRDNQTKSNQEWTIPLKASAKTYTMKVALGIFFYTVM
jgi:hypothetical protein